MSVLDEIVRLSDPALRPYAADRLPPPRWRGRAGGPDRELVFEAVYEAFLLHYGEPRAFVAMDEDMRLLAGDALYALALELLAERGDLEAIAELANLISQGAQAEAEGRAEAAAELWAASARVLAGQR